MKVIFCLGAPVVGKLTTSQELSKLLGYPVYSNHWIRAAITKSFGKYDHELAREIRSIFVEKIIDSGYEGVVIPYCLNFDSEQDKKGLEQRMSLFDGTDAEFYFVELVAPPHVREFRLHTYGRIMSGMSLPTIAERDDGGRYLSSPGELQGPNKLVVDTSHTPPNGVVSKIVNVFNLA